ncbi:MAG: hypothetical protein HY693_03620, partial [Deltaproteobacteria bacterium]|nr:hypothetical protein [Deltaproteobacteria bacterium]
MKEVSSKSHLFPILIALFLVSLIGCENDEGKQIVIKGNVHNASATVEAIVNGQIVDSADTDANGNYRLRVSNDTN